MSVVVVAVVVVVEVTVVTTGFLAVEYSTTSHSLINIVTQTIIQVLVCLALSIRITQCYNGHVETIRQSMWIGWTFAGGEENNAEIVTHGFGRDGQFFGGGRL